MVMVRSSVRLALVTIFLVSGAIVRPIRSVTDAAIVLEDEEREFEPEMLSSTVTRGDELGQRSRIFRKMAVEVQEREKKLKQQLTDLKIEIDLSRQEEQVSQITDTDYFQDLAARSSELRKRRGTGRLDPSKAPEED